MAKKNNDLTCAKCNQPAPWLTQTGTQWVGPCCVPDDIWKMYPGWKERERKRQKTHEKRATIARRNFHHQEVSAA